MMNIDKSYIDALTYLYSFSGGLSHYNWDRALTYKLNYGIHPGEFIRCFIAEGLITNEVPVSSKNYELSLKGKELVRTNLEELSPVLDSINDAIDKVVSKGIDITIDRHPPYYLINYLNRRIVLWIKRVEGFTEIVCSFPSETESKVNTLSLTVEMLKKTNLLFDILNAHLSYIKMIRATPIA